MKTTWSTGSIRRKWSAWSRISRRGEVAAELHLSRGAERARQRAAGLRRDADRAPPVAVAHEHRLDRMAVARAEQRLHRPVARVRLVLDRQRRERDVLLEPRAQRGRNVRHLVVSRGASRSPLPDLAAPVGRLVGEGLVRGASCPSGHGSARLFGNNGRFRRMVDLRSDTATKPTRGMREAMANAEVGDDQKREDPTVLELERRVAELLGQEDAVYLPTASMANQIACLILTRAGRRAARRGERAPPALGAGRPGSPCGLVTRPIRSLAGRFGGDDVRALMRDRTSMHMSRTRLVSIENTHNSSGGRCLAARRGRRGRRRRRASSISRCTSTARGC